MWGQFCIQREGAGMNIYDGGWWAVGSRAVPEKIFAKDGQLCIYQSKEKAEEEARRQNARNEQRERKLTFPIHPC